jgi:hypothetical protein
MRCGLLRACLALATLGAAAGGAEAAGWSIALKSDRKRELGVVEGQVRLVQVGTPAVREWRIEDGGKKGRLIRVMSSDKWNGWYLTYDHTGKGKEVFLSEKPTPGSYWHLRVGGDRGGRSGTIEATAGRVEGRHLSVGGPAEKLVDVDGKTHTASRLVLSGALLLMTEFFFEEVAG